MTSIRRTVCGDYLRINLEPSIMASPDGHRWALAADVLERCEAMGGEELHLRLLKTIALVGFAERPLWPGSEPRYPRTCAARLRFGRDRTSSSKTARPSATYLSQV